MASQAELKLVAADMRAGGLHFSRTELRALSEDVVADALAENHCPVTRQKKDPRFEENRLSAQSMTMGFLQWQVS